MKDVMSALLKSKKFWVFVITVAVVVLNRTLDLNLTGEDLVMVGGSSVATTLGFGAADLGKEKAKIEAGGE